MAEWAPAFCSMTHQQQDWFYVKKHQLSHPLSLAMHCTPANRRWEKGKGDVGENLSVQYMLCNSNRWLLSTWTSKQPPPAAPNNNASNSSLPMIVPKDTTRGHHHHGMTTQRPWQQPLLVKGQPQTWLTPTSRPAPIMDLTVSCRTRYNLANLDSNGNINFEQIANL